MTTPIHHRVVRAAAHGHGLVDYLGLTSVYRALTDPEPAVAPQLDVCGLCGSEHLVATSSGTLCEGCGAHF
jgi:hypothetical protein